MRSLLIVAATAVGFALPAATDTSPGSRNPSYNTPSYGPEASGQQANRANSGQQNWADGRRVSRAMPARVGRIETRTPERPPMSGSGCIRTFHRRASRIFGSCPALLVHAKDRDGNLVTMMITPNSAMALITVPGNGGQSMSQQGGPGSM